MVFNDTTTKNGAIQKCEEWIFGSNYGTISSNSTLLLKFTNLLNIGLDKTKAVLYKSDSRWQDDDPNFVDIAEATTDLSDGIAEYTLDKSHLIIDGFEVMDSSGKYYPLLPIDYKDIREQGISKSQYAPNDGLPVRYDIKGDVVTLFPAPATANVTLSNGLKILYKRESSYFVSTDTIKEMGIPRTFHDIPCLFACNEYAKQNSMGEKARELDAEIISRSKDLKQHYLNRNKDEETILTSESINSI